LKRSGKITGKIRIMNIPIGLFQNGKGNSGRKMNNKYAENITLEEIKNLELKWFDREIIVVDNHQTFRRIINRISNCKTFGFDTETRPSFRKGRKNKVSLLQLATGNIACLFRINSIGIPDELIQILSDPGIIKSGVALHDDLKNLKNIRKFEPGGFIDLQGFVKDHGIQSSGLKKLTAIVLGFRISKSQQVTNWDAEDLSGPQQIYAATDAWVCYEIYKKLITT
jgi:ribonuclease D